MKVTDFYPIFYTNDVEAEIERYAKDLGFALKHRPEIEFLDYAVLENKNGRRIDLVCSHFPSDSFTEGYLGMRANVKQVFPILQNKATRSSANRTKRQLRSLPY